MNPFKIFSFLFIFNVFTTSFCQVQQHVHIPEYMYFAGMKLHFSKGLQQELEKQVLSLTKNTGFYQAKVDRADAYFPIIERVFREEGLPQDFKYLVLQESGLQSDVVSKSNAVGFWQFKKESAEEVGLKINHHMDERMHITASTRGAARYLKKNYLLLTNWLYTLIAYNTGYGGVKPYIDAKYIGVSEMELDENTHWYAVKFLAHKLAFEEKVGYNTTPPLVVLEYQQFAEHHLDEIALETGIPSEKLIEYNKWLLKQKLPGDGAYVVILPTDYMQKANIAQKLGIPLIEIVKPIPTDEVQAPSVPSFPQPTPEWNKSRDPVDRVPMLAIANGLKAIIARPTDVAVKLAFAGGISPAKFLKYNEMENFQDVKPGQIYYLEAKNKRALVLYHTVQAKETAWDIAQKYGITKSALFRKNRMNEEDALQEGRLLYLKYQRPEKEPVVISEKTLLAANKIYTTTQRAPTLDESKSTAIAQESKHLPMITTKLAQDTTQKNAIKAMRPDSLISINAEKLTEKKEIASPKPILEQAMIPSLKKVNKQHLVQQGQTLYGLARYYNTKVDSIKVWNVLGDQGIKPQQTLIVGQNMQESETSVDFNESIMLQQGKLDSLATVLKVQVEKIKVWNGKKDDFLIPGEIIRYR